MKTAPEIPPLVPEPDDISRPFWDGCNRGELVLQTCAQCRRPRYHPRPMCPHCQSLEAEWVPASGRGTVYSWVVAHPPLLPALAERAPLPVLLVELDEGVRMVGNLAGADADALEIGLPVQVEFVRVTDDVALPAWRPVVPVR